MGWDFVMKIVTRPDARSNPEIVGKWWKLFVSTLVFSRKEEKIEAETWVVSLVWHHCFVGSIPGAGKLVNIFCFSSHKHLSDIFVVFHFIPLLAPQTNQKSIEETFNTSACLQDEQENDRIKCHLPLKWGDGKDNYSDRQPGEDNHTTIWKDCMDPRS